MLLAIVRHGKAEARPEGGSDRDRRLRPRGERQARWLGERFAREHRPALILSSPFERAITTARLINESLRLHLQTARELECDEPVSRAIHLIEGSAGDSPLMLVGHNPQLSGLASALLHGVGSRRLELRTGEAAVL
jgi:phosphohistidine phosphatase